MQNQSECKVFSTLQWKSPWNDLLIQLSHIGAATCMITEMFTFWTNVEKISYILKLS